MTTGASGGSFRCGNCAFLCPGAEPIFLFEGLDIAFGACLQSSSESTGLDVPPPPAPRKRTLSKGKGTTGTPDTRAPRSNTLEEQGIAIQRGYWGMIEGQFNLGGWKDPGAEITGNDDGAGGAGGASGNSIPSEDATLKLVFDNR